MSQLSSKVTRVLEVNSKLKHHYEFLLNKKKVADKALEEFIVNIENQNDRAQPNIDPSDIDDYDKAVDYLNVVLLKQRDKLDEIMKCIENQQELEKVWEFTHKRYIQESVSDEMMQEFYKYMMEQLEDFSKKCHQKFYGLGIPLFCIKKAKLYKNLSKDRRKLILYIQDNIENYTA